VLSTFLTKTIFTPAVMLGGKADSMLGLVQINLQQGIVGLAVCYLVQVRLQHGALFNAGYRPLFW
jgi:hypothetical protein